MPTDQAKNPCRTLGQKLKELKEPPTNNHRHGLLDRNRCCEFQTPFIHHCRRRPELAATTHIPISPTPVATITTALARHDSDRGRIGIGIGIDISSSARTDSGIAATSSEPAAGPARSIQFDHSDARDHTISHLLSFQVRQQQQCQQLYAYEWEPILLPSTFAGFHPQASF